MQIPWSLPKWPWMGLGVLRDNLDLPGMWSPGSGAPMLTAVRQEGAPFLEVSDRRHSGERSCRMFGMHGLSWLSRAGGNGECPAAVPLNDTIRVTAARSLPDAQTSKATLPAPFGLRRLTLPYKLPGAWPWTCLCPAWALRHLWFY